MHICDPAVGSGHFLVSALNEIIVIKAELGILADEKGNNLNGYEIEIVNDELIITDQQGNPVEYKLQSGKPLSKEVQRLQRTLFLQKQTIIENCLFGVDINPKSECGHRRLVCSGRVGHRCPVSGSPVRHDMNGNGGTFLQTFD